jgi:lysozyme
MDVFNSALLILQRHEGLKLKPYPDTGDTLAIGHGRNLMRKGITAEEAEFLLRGDVTAARDHLRTDTRTKDIYRHLTAARKVVLLDMVVNLGFGGVLGFKRMWAALKEGDHAKAAEEMLDSKWAKQVPKRAGELAQLMEKPEYLGEALRR